MAKGRFTFTHCYQLCCWFSTYNSIKHLWAPVSKKLTGVKGRPWANGDDIAPTLLPMLTKEEIEKKEIEVFDRISEELKSVYLKDFPYDDFPVHVENIECQANLQEKFNLKKICLVYSSTCISSSRRQL